MPSRQFRVLSQPQPETFYFLDEEAGEFYFNCSPGGEDEPSAGERKRLEVTRVWPVGW